MSDHSAEIFCTFLWHVTSFTVFVLFRYFMCLAHSGLPAMAFCFCATFLKYLTFQPHFSSFKINSLLKNLSKLVCCLHISVVHFTCCSVHTFFSLFSVNFSFFPLCYLIHQMCSYGSFLLILCFSAFKATFQQFCQFPLFQSISFAFTLNFVSALSAENYHNRYKCLSTTVIV